MTEQKEQWVVLTCLQISFCLSRVGKCFSETRESRSKNYQDFTVSNSELPGWGRVWDLWEFLQALLASTWNGPRICCYLFFLKDVFIWKAERHWEVGTVTGSLPAGGSCQPGDRPSQELHPGLLQDWGSPTPRAIFSCLPRHLSRNLA